MTHEYNTARRFAGSISFDVGRYFTVCHDVAGDDDRTLANELSAYLDPVKTGPAFLLDSVCKQSREFAKELGFTLPERPCLTAFLMGSPALQNRLIEDLRVLGFDNGAADEQARSAVAMTIEIDYDVTTVEIDDCLDLRLVDDQEFLIEEFFNKDTAVFINPHRSKIQRFVDVLPILMNPQHGGGRRGDECGITMFALGAFLRSSGFNGLIFPSARSNVILFSKHRHLESWRGWNFVDYRGLALPDTIYHDQFSEWPRLFYKGAVIKRYENEYEGSFNVEGICEAINRQHNEALKQLGWVFPGLSTPHHDT